VFSFWPQSFQDEKKFSLDFFGGKLDLCKSIQSNQSREFTQCKGKTLMYIQRGKPLSVLIFEIAFIKFAKIVFFGRSKRKGRNSDHSRFGE
jgi:hypothetical protein